MKYEDEKSMEINVLKPTNLISNKHLVIRSFVRRSSQSEAVVYLENGLTARITIFYMDIHTSRVYNHTG